MNHEEYMRRAIRLAFNGHGKVSPNPMVGALIVAPQDRIIGEGWHGYFGGPHAEVNAVESVAPENRYLLPFSTLYVTLEPCAHYGKTPPCAAMIVDKRFHKVVIGCSDPFSKVAGKGIELLKKAGIDVKVGVLHKECLCLNRKFFFSHTAHRPYITLKWAQSIDGWMDCTDNSPFPFSTPLTRTLVHRLRADNDFIITSTKTVNNDNPRMDIRLWHHGNIPRCAILGNSSVESDKYLSAKKDTLKFPSSYNLSEVLDTLYHSYGAISALVEAGPSLLNSFINEGLWNEIRVEVNPIRLGKRGQCKAPHNLPAPSDVCEIDGNHIYTYLQRDK